MPNIAALVTVAAVMFAVLGAITLIAHIYNLNNIKSKTVGDGQHGTARWANKAEIRKTYRHIPFTPKKWRKQAKQNQTPTMTATAPRKLLRKKAEPTEEALPQGIVVGCKGGKHSTTAMIDTGDVHVLMIGAAGVGKTAFWLYPCIEYACASGMSFLSTDTNIENNHPAIIDAGTFARVQEEIARRSGKPKVKQKGTKTELSRYSSKYALSELLICGECRTPYRRCTWTAKGKRKIVWRCINRLDYGKKYCHHSPSIEESLLQDAVMRAIMQTAKQNIEVLKTLKIHIGMGLTDEVTEDKTLDIQIQIAEIDAEFQKMLKAVSADNADGIDEERITELMNEKQRLTVQLEQYATMRQKRESAKSRLDEIFTILDGLQNHPMEYDDKLVRQIIECVVVESKEKIKVVFIGGTEIEMVL